MKKKQMMKRSAKLNMYRLLLLGSLMVFAGCGNDSRVTASGETTTKGTIRISVDESFRPIIDSQIRVFESLYSDAKVIAEYKSEAECMKDLTKDSTRLIIVTKELSRDEEAFMRDTLGFKPPQGRVAYDAITVIVNSNAKDSIFDLADIRSMLKGTSGYKYKVVMDGLSATSTVRFAIDSILGGESFGSNVMAAKSSQGVIDYVAENPDAIGFVGVSWIGNREDPSQLSFLKRVRIASLECRNCDRKTYVKPYQANIAMRRYPYVRGLYYVLKENYEGLGSGFVNFLIYEKGQLIFRRAYLWPAKMPFEVRNAGIDQEQ